MTSKNRKQIFISLALITALILVLPMISAADTATLNKPIAGTNLTTILINCTTNIPNALNATITYNVTGGSSRNFTLATIINNSADPLHFYSASTSIEFLADAATYNFSCLVSNATAAAWSPGIYPITIDNTVPVTVLTASGTKIVQKGSIAFNYSSSDALSGLSTIVTTVTVAGDGGCTEASAISYSNSGANVTLSGEQTRCAGLYTATMTATDLAGNVKTDTTTFNIYHPEGGSITISGSGTPVVSGTMPPQVLTFRDKFTLFFQRIGDFFRNLFKR